MATERITVRAGNRFDPTNPTHLDAVLQMIAEKTDHGTGWKLQSHNPDDGSITLIRQSAITQVSKSSARRDSYDVGLMSGTKLADGAQVAAQLESDPRHQGYIMTAFEPYLGTATLSKMTTGAIRCRGAVATALGVKPWDVRVTPRADGGFELVLPRGYVPSRHDSKLQEVADTVVGRDGWYVATDPQKLTASIIPADPPTFPAVIPYPLSLARKVNSESRLLLATALGKNGNETGETIYLDFDASPHTSLTGTTGSGKAQPLSDRVPVPVSAAYPDGWARVGDLRVGDAVFAADGTVARTVGFSDVVVEECFDVEFSDGQVVRTTGGHEWRVQDSAQRMNDNNAKRKNGTARRAGLRARAGALRELAGAFHYGRALTVAHLVQASGISRPQVRTMMAESGITRIAVSTDKPPVVVASTRAVGHFPTGTALQVLRERGLGTAVTEHSRFGEETTARGLARAIAIGDNKAAAAKVRRALRAARVPEIVRRAHSRRRSVMGPHTILAYAADEALRYLADVLDTTADNIGRTTAPYRVVTTAALAEHATASDGSSEFSVGLATAFDVPDQLLPLDPYVLGAWLGDGTSIAGKITSADPEIIQHVLDAGFVNSSSRQAPGNAATAYYFRGLLGDLRRAGQSMKKSGKRIPAVYRRASYSQRLALLQGLMDTDGTIGKLGHAEFCVTLEPLAGDVLELIRSLGIRASMTVGDAIITEADPVHTDRKRRRKTGLRYRIAFTTDKPVFRLGRKAARLPMPDTGAHRDKLYIVDVRPAGRHRARCLRVDHPDHLYLTHGFIPTHNTVTINSLIAGALASGYELAIIDVPHKAVDFTWARRYVHSGFWGCDSLEAAATVATLVYEEGQRRAAVLKTHDVTKISELPQALQPRPLLVVMDEVSGLFQPDDVPRGIPKDHPLVVAALDANGKRAILMGMTLKLAAEMRFVGIRLLLSTQVANATTGIPPKLRSLLNNKLLQGVNTTDAIRRQVFNDPTAVPSVPGNIRGDSKVAKGVGVLEMEGAEPTVYKGFYAVAGDYSKLLSGLGVEETVSPSPSADDIARVTQSLGADDAPPPDRRARRADGLAGAAAAAHDLRTAAA